MRRRAYLTAVATALGVAAGPGTSTADDDDERYEAVSQEFADVTWFAAPNADETASEYVRLYDDTTETLVYGTTHGTDSVVMATRDAAEVDLTS